MTSGPIQDRPDSSQGAVSPVRSGQSVVTRDGERFIAARDLLLRLRDDRQTAYDTFQWPRLEWFNWALDYFDRIAIGNDDPALRIVNGVDVDETFSYAQMALRSTRVANFLLRHGLKAGDRVLLCLDNCVALWETMLAVMKLGAVAIPATTLLGADDLRDRVERGAVKCAITHSHLADRFAGIDRGLVRISVGEPVPGWIEYADSECASEVLSVSGRTRADSPLLLYFTSGTTTKPKLVEHSHASYPVGHLSTMYWLGLRQGDVHLNLSSPGWAKHAWSCIFAPWNAQSCVLIYKFERFDARKLLDVILRCSATSFCAPPTVWRLLIQHDLADWPVKLREVTSAGEPLNPEVIECVRNAWNLTIRDGFGQTETTAVIGNPPGQAVKTGSMGRPLPGYRIALLDTDGRPSSEGEICIDVSPRPVGLMNGYGDAAAQTAIVIHDGFYHTGDIASCDPQGYLTYVGRVDDVFKSSDYRISPFELESVLIEHAAVAEAAVVPSPDPIRLHVPKAFVVLAQGFHGDADTARSILQHVRERVSPYKRIRRIEFRDLPKTISGKIRRSELRHIESKRGPDASCGENEYWE
jgi:acetyl-CoA synthetase